MSTIIYIFLSRYEQCIIDKINVHNYMHISDKKQITSYF
jgi:hypothetical protein